MAPCSHNADPHRGFRPVAKGVSTPTRSAPAGTTTTTQPVLHHAHASVVTGLEV